MENTQPTKKHGKSTGKNHGKSTWEKSMENYPDDKKA